MFHITSCKQMDSALANLLYSLNLIFPWKMGFGQVRKMLPRLWDFVILCAPYKVSAWWHIG